MTKVRSDLGQCDLDIKRGAQALCHFISSRGFFASLSLESCGWSSHPLWRGWLHPTADFEGRRSHRRDHLEEHLDLEHRHLLEIRICLWSLAHLRSSSQSSRSFHLICLTQAHRAKVHSEPWKLQRKLQRKLQKVHQLQGLHQPLLYHQLHQLHKLPKLQRLHLQAQQFQFGVHRRHRPHHELDYQSH